MSLFLNERRGKAEARRIDYKMSPSSPLEQEVIDGALEAVESASSSCFSLPLSLECSWLLTIIDNSMTGMVSRQWITK